MARLPWPEPDDFIVEKRRDSVFQDTEFDLWLKASRADTVIFSGIDTNICAQSSMRDAFNNGWDVIPVNDCVASRNLDRHQSTLAQVGETYAWVMSSREPLGRVESEELELSTTEEAA